MRATNKPVTPPPAPPPGAPAGTTLAELRGLETGGERVVLLDVRKERAYREAETQAKGAIRLPPEGDVAAKGAELALPRHAWLVAYCAWNDAATSARVARELQQAGWPRALLRGWARWEATGMSVERTPAAG